MKKIGLGMDILRNAEAAFICEVAYMKGRTYINWVEIDLV